MNRRDAIAALVALPSVKAIAQADVAPRSVIVVECDDRLSEAAVRQIYATLERVWPGHKIVVLDQGLHLRIERGA